MLPNHSGVMATSEPRPRQANGLRRPPLFIVGCPRSGTTLLAELLKESPWGQPTETHFIPKYFRQLSRYQPLHDVAQFSRLVRAIASERPVMQWRIDINPETLHASVNGYDYAAVVDSICQLRSTRHGKNSWGDKTPHYVFHLDTLSELFPHSKFINVVRDGRDVALSLLGRPWGPANIYACAMYWRRHTEPTHSRKKLLDEGRMLELRYETLLSSPHATVKMLYGFLNEEVPISIDEAIGRIQSQNSGRWRTTMKPDDVRLFEAAAGDRLELLGYATTHPTGSIARSEKLRYLTHDYLHWIAFMLRQNLIDAVRIRYFGKAPFAE